MVKLIKKDQVVERTISDSHSVNNFVTKDFSKNVSLAIGVGQDYSGTSKSVRSDRVYYVTEGKLIVNKDLVAEVGDVIFVPKGEEYSFEGTFKAVVVNAPAFDSSKETK